MMFSLPRIEITVNFKSKHTALAVSIKVEAEKESYESDRLDPRTDATWACNLWVETAEIELLAHMHIPPLQLSLNYDSNNYHSS